MKYKNNSDVLFSNLTSNNIPSANNNNNDSNAISIEFSSRKMKNTNTSEIEMNRSQSLRESKDLINKENILNKIIPEEKSINLIKIYYHLNRPIDWLFIFLGIIGSLGAGISSPIMSFTTSEVYSKIANTSENRDSQYNLEEMENIVKKTMDYKIKSLLVYGAISFLCYFMSICFWSLVGNRCIYNLKKNYFTIILNQEQAWFDASNPFELGSSVNAQLANIEQGIGDKVGVVITLFAQCIIGLILSFISTWKLTLVMLSVAPLSIFFPNFLIISMRNGIILSRRTWSTAGGMAEEMLYNIKTVASFANFDYELNKFYQKIEIVWRMDLKNSWKLGFAVGFIKFFLDICIFIGFIYGRTLIKIDYNSNKGRDFTGGDIISAAFCTLIGISAIGMIAPNIKTIQDACSAFSDYYSLYHRKPEIDLSNSVEKPPLSQIEGKIEFNEIRFYYPSDPNKRIILNGINLLFESGKKIALVGESGCGKSTIVNLIERLYDINEGKILIDGIEINRYDIYYLRSFIGYVQQEPVLFNKSIRDNIIFGREEYLKSIGNIDELIQKACEEAYVNEFLDSLPGKLNYIVGVKGSKLSGGQKQRIAIARAILTRPKILILDEATSFLDNKSEKEVQRALDNISQKKVTTIIIAHRLSTIKNADLIYTIKGGKVIEQGTHDELLELGGYYAGLICSQLGKEEDNEDNEILENSFRSKNTEEEIHFERKDKEISLTEDDIPLRPCIIISELSDFKTDLVLAIFGACILGCLCPINGFTMAKGINGLNSKYQTVRFDEGFKYGFVFLAFAFLQGTGNYLMLWKFQSLGYTLAKIYRKKILQKYLQFHLSYFDLIANSPGSLITRLSHITLELNQMIMAILGTTIQCSCIVIIGLVLGCIYEYRLTLINFSFVPFIVLANVLRKTMVHGPYRRGFKGNIEAGGILSECVINTKTIFSFNYQKSAINMYLEAIEFVRQLFLRDSFINGLFIGLGNFCSFAGYAAVYAATKKYILNGTLDSEQMSIAMSIVTTCAQGLSNGMGNLGDLKKANIAFKSIYSTLGTKSLISPFYKDNITKISANNIKGKIELKHVYFAYPTRPETIVLKDVSLTIMPGQHVALVGYSGSGKSTIIQLLTRFYDIEEGKGEILIDDINIKNYNLYELRKKIGLVSQEPSLFKISVLENVRYGKLDATDEECIEAAKQANIMKFFTKDRINEIIEESNKQSIKLSHRFNKFLSSHGPHGSNGPYSTHGLRRSIVGKKIGAKKDPVSGGEKQRLAIARAFLKNPTILLLDEATSAMDKESEIEVQKSLDKLAENRTCISIAHRLNTIEKCDQIFVLDNGRLVEQGKHDQLMKLGKKYFTLHKFSNIE